MAPTGFKPRPIHVILEFIGTILIGVGLAETYAKTNLVPAQWQFENYGWVMMAAGFLLTVPHTISVIKYAKAKAKSRSGSTS